MLEVWLKCQRTKVLPFKTSWHFHQGQVLLSVSEREDGKREGLDMLASVLISFSICILLVPISLNQFCSYEINEEKVLAVLCVLMVCCQDSPLLDLVDF